MTNCTFNGLVRRVLAGRFRAAILIPHIKELAYRSSPEQHRQSLGCALSVLYQGYDMDYETMPGVALGRMRPDAILMDCTPDGLPNRTTAVYFLVSAEFGLLYVGKATDMRGRWVHGFHHHLVDSLLLGDVTLRWLVVSRDSLADTERLFIGLLDPAFNGSRRAQWTAPVHARLDALKGGAERFRRAGMWSKRPAR